MTSRVNIGSLASTRRMGCARRADAERQAQVWTLVTAAAVLTERVRLGTLACGITYRNPALLAKICASVDHISGGRMELGIGAAWFEREHQAYGWDFRGRSAPASVTATSATWTSGIRAASTSSATSRRSSTATARTPAAIRGGQEDGLPALPALRQRPGGQEVTWPALVLLGHRHLRSGPAAAVRRGRRRGDHPVRRPQPAGGMAADRRGHPECVPLKSLAL